MSHIEKKPEPSKTVTYKTGCHWVVMVWPVAAGCALALVGTTLLAAGWLGRGRGATRHAAIVEGSVFFPASTVLIGRRILRRITTQVTVSNTRVMIRTGWFSRKSIEVLLSRVESIATEETVAGRFLGYGTVEVRGIGGTCERLERIRRPGELQRQVRGEWSTVDSPVSPGALTHR